MYILTETDHADEDGLAPDISKLTFPVKTLHNSKFSKIHDKA